MTGKKLIDIESPTFKAVVRQVFTELLQEGLGEFQKPQQMQNAWYPTDPAYQLLGLRRAAELRRKRQSLPFKEGYHYRLSNQRLNSRRPTYEFHIDRCRELLNTPRHQMRPKF